MNRPVALAALAIFTLLASARFAPEQSEESRFAITNRDDVAAMMTPEQIAEAQRLAAEWKPKPATRGTK